MYDVSWRTGAHSDVEQLISLMVFVINGVTTLASSGWMLKRSLPVSALSLDVEHPQYILCNMRFRVYIFSREQQQAKKH